VIIMAGTFAATLTRNGNTPWGAPFPPEPNFMSPVISWVPTHKDNVMARKYSKAASKKVETVMKERKEGTLKSGRSGKKVKSRKQAIAIGLSEARKEGKKVPAKKASKKKKG
jgi:hypothetical protein